MKKILCITILLSLFSSICFASEVVVRRNIPVCERSGHGDVSLPYLTKIEVRQIADEYATENGLNIEEWNEPTIRYIEKYCEWYVVYNCMKNPPDTGKIVWSKGQIGISIADDGGEVVNFHHYNPGYSHLLKK